MKMKRHDEGLRKFKFGQWRMCIFHCVLWTDTYMFRSWVSTDALKQNGMEFLERLDFDLQ
jgi:hypothetical protein